MDLTAAPIIFLHIPKTAGQTVHNSLSRMVTARRVSPFRVHTQAPVPEDQFPPGYSLYSGHLDWDAVGHLPKARFIFTVLRDPSERIASFYFYLQRKAAALSPKDLDLPHNIGLKRALEWAPDDYFFGGDETWQTFVHSHYDNFYCTYFATRRMLGWGATVGENPSKTLANARLGLASLDGVYSTDQMAQMEIDFQHRYGHHLSIVDRFDNSSGEPSNTLRWPRLLASFQSDLAAERMHDFTRLDRQLTQAIL
jgi:hypothetical protein